MVYIKKTGNVLKSIYALLAGIALIVWVFTFGPSKSSGIGQGAIPKALADTPSSSDSGGTDSSSVDGACGNGEDAGGPGDSGSGSSDNGATGGA